MLVLVLVAEEIVLGVVVAVVHPDSPGGGGKLDVGGVVPGFRKKGERFLHAFDTLGEVDLGFPAGGRGAHFAIPARSKEQDGKGQKQCWTDVFHIRLGTS